MSRDAEPLSSLRRVPLLSELSDEMLARIAPLLTEFEVSAGHVLIQSGQPGSGLFLIGEGTVDVELPGRTLTLGPGSFVGELALLTDAERMARVRAASRVSGWAIGRGDFAELLRTEPRVAVAMLPVLARRLADAEA
jgi:CRP-like cAMP-binding protein